MAVSRRKKLWQADFLLKLFNPVAAAVVNVTGERKVLG